LSAAGFAGVTGFAFFKTSGFLAGAYLGAIAAPTLAFFIAAKVFFTAAVEASGRTVGAAGS